MIQYQAEKIADLDRRVTALENSGYQSEFVASAEAMSTNRLIRALTEARRVIVLLGRMNPPNKTDSPCWCPETHDAERYGHVHECGAALIALSCANAALAETTTPVVSRSGSRDDA